MPDDAKLWERAVQSIGKAIGVPAVSLHSLRHTHASLLLNRGVDVLTVSKRLGYSGQWPPQQAGERALATPTTH